MDGSGTSVLQAGTDAEKVCHGGEGMALGTTLAPNQGYPKAAPGTGTCLGAHQGLMSGNLGCGKVPLGAE